MQEKNKKRIDKIILVSIIASAAGFLLVTKDRQIYFMIAFGITLLTYIILQVYNWLNKRPPTPQPEQPLYQEQPVPQHDSFAESYINQNIPMLETVNEIEGMKNSLKELNTYLDSTIVDRKKLIEKYEDVQRRVGMMMVALKKIYVDADSRLKYLKPRI